MRTHLTNLFAAAAILSAACLSGCKKDQPEGKPEKDFEITLVSASQGGLVVKTVPQQDDMTYWCGIITKDEYEAGGSDSGQLASEAVSTMADMAEQTGETISEVIMRCVSKGTKEFTFNGLSPETAYIVYAFGLQTDGEILTEVNTAEFSTVKAEYLGTKFTISAEDVTPTGFRLKIVPDDNQARYYYNVLDQAGFESFCGADPGKLAERMEAYFKALREQYPDMTEGEFVESITVTGETSDGESFQNLSPQSAFHAFAVSVANDMSLLSEVAYKELSTAAEPKNEFSVTDENTTDVTYNAVVNTTTDEYYAAVLELKEYFEGLDDDEAIEALAEANGGNFTKYLHSGDDYVEFGRLIPSDEYLLMIFTCSPDGTPLTGEGVTNLTRHEVSTAEALPSETTYELSVDNISQETARVHVTAVPAGSTETFMLNTIKKADYDLMGDKSAGLKEDMNKFWEGRLAEWKAENPEYADAMTMKEFMSRYLLDQASYGTTYEVDRLEEATEYYAYVIGMKPDGTFTTEPFTVPFTTAGNQESLANIDDIIVMALDRQDGGITDYHVWVYPGGDYDVFHVKYFTGTDEWASKSKDEILQGLKNERGNKWSESFVVSSDWGSQWYFYAVCIDTKGVACDIQKISYTTPASGEGTTGLSQKEVDVEITTL